MPETPPVVAEVPPVSITEISSPKSFTVNISDLHTAPGALTLSAVSSNQLVLPDNRITITGEGSARTVTVNPLPSETGTITVTLTVGDGTLSSTRDVTLIAVEVHQLEPTSSDISFDLELLTYPKDTLPSPKPSLTPTGVVVEWPTRGTSWKLQGSDDLVTWTTITTTPETTPEGQRVTLPASSAKSSTDYWPSEPGQFLRSSLEKGLPESWVFFIRGGKRRLVSVVLALGRTEGRGNGG